MVVVEAGSDLVDDDVVPVQGHLGGLVRTRWQSEDQVTVRTRWQSEDQVKVRSM